MLSTIGRTTPIEHILEDQSVHNFLRSYIHPNKSGYYNGNDVNIGVKTKLHVGVLESNKFVPFCFRSRQVCYIT